MDDKTKKTKEEEEPQPAVVDPRDVDYWKKPGWRPWPPGLGAPAPEGVFDRLVHITDESGDGLIDYAEFARLATTDFKPANPANRWNPNRYLDRRTRGLG